MLNTKTFRIEPQNPEGLSKLELASEYLAATKNINRSAFPTFLFGIVNVVFFVRSGSHSPYEVALFLDGVALITVGIYMTRSPKPVTMLINAFLLWASSMWYMFGWHNVMALLGLFGIWQGAREFNRWLRFRGHFQSPHDPIVHHAAEIIDAIQEVLPAHSSCALELYVSGDRWLGMFSDPVIAFLNPDRHLFFCNVANIDIQEQGKTVIGGFRKLLIRISSGKVFSVTIRPEYLERLRDWSKSRERSASAVRSL